MSLSTRLATPTFTSCVCSVLLSFSVWCACCMFLCSWMHTILFYFSTVGIVYTVIGVISDEWWTVLTFIGCWQWWWMAVIDWGDGRHCSCSCWHFTDRQRQGVRAQAEDEAKQFFISSRGCRAWGCFSAETSSADHQQYFDAKMVCLLVTYIVFM